MDILGKIYIYIYIYYLKYPDYEHLKYIIYIF